MAVQRPPPPQPVTCRNPGTEAARAGGCLVALIIKHPCNPIPVCCCISIAILLPGGAHNFFLKGIYPVYTQYNPSENGKVYTRYIPYIWHFNMIGIYIPGIYLSWLTLSYDRYIPGIYLSYDRCRHMSGTYQKYTMVINFQGFPDEVLVIISNMCKNIS